MNTSQFLFILFFCFFLFFTGAENESVNEESRSNRSHRYANNIDLSTVEEIVPLEAKTFYENLTTEDRSILQKVLSKGSTYSNISEVLNDLKNGSSTLYDRAVSIVTTLRSTVAALSEPARNFVDETIAQIRRALGEKFSIGKVKAEANVIVERYRVLNETTKEELKSAFPAITTVVYNNVFQTLAVGLLGITSN